MPSFWSSSPNVAWNSRRSNSKPSESDDSYEEIGLDPDDFDVVFTYPWPHEEEVVFRLFERFTAPGAILVTFHGADDIRLRRKTSRTKKRPRRKNHG